MNEYPVELIADHKRLSAMVVKLIEQYQHKITIQVVDPQSLMGIYKSIRHLVRRYPTFIINDRTKITGWEEEALFAAVERCLTVT